MMPSLQVMLAMSSDAWFLKAFMRIPLAGDLERSIFFSKSDIVFQVSYQLTSKELC